MDLAILPIKYDLAVHKNEGVCLYGHNAKAEKKLYYSYKIDQVMG